MDTCHVSNQDCCASPGVSDGDLTRAECFACGLPVCVKCSKRVRYFKWGRKRVCDHCREEHGVGEYRKLRETEV